MPAPPSHRKHAELVKPDLGFFSRNEWAIMGAPCGPIRQLAYALTERLSKRFRIVYVDADHKGADEETGLGRDLKSALAHGAALEYTDKITFHRFDREEKFDTFQFRQEFYGLDVALVNGNHFAAKKQIVIIDPKKEASLQKKLDRLSGVELFLLTETGREIYPFLRNHLENRQSIPVLEIADTEAIASFLEHGLKASTPPLYGLVLAGGKSLRMGLDKGLIDYHGKPQREYVADLLGNFCEQTFISCRPEQVAEIGDGYRVLPDTFLGLGPFGAILSAFRENPDCAWLVAACDLPLLDDATLAQLVKSRNPSRVATAFNSPANEFPEPLITIWEPRAYPALLQFLAQGYSCPRKALINSDVELINAADPLALTNVNEQEEMEMVKERLKSINSRQ
jgi:molybdenum cofactor guanylyltransferase